MDVDLDLSNNWQTSQREYHASEKEEMLLAMFRLQAGLERLSHHGLTVSSCRLFHAGIECSSGDWRRMNVGYHGCT